MMLHIPNVLTAEQVAHCRAVMERATWTDGRVTAGYQSAQVKRNQQLPDDGPEARELGDLVLAGLERSALFVSAGNPVLSVPDGPGLARALGRLDLLVSLDLQLNETNRPGG